MGKDITLRVRPLDRAPMYGTGGESVPLWDTDRKSTAAKIPEEAAEAFHEFQDFEMRAHDLRAYRDFVMYEDPQTVNEKSVELQHQRQRLGDELADVIVAAVDLALICGVDLNDALERHEVRQIERGRIDG